MQLLQSTPSWSPTLGHWAPGTFLQQEGLCSVHHWNYHYHPKHLFYHMLFLLSLLEMVCASGKGKLKFSSRVDISHL